MISDVVNQLIPVDSGFTAYRYLKSSAAQLIISSAVLPLAILSLDQVLYEKQISIKVIMNQEGSRP